MRWVLAGSAVVIGVLAIVAVAVIFIAFAVVLFLTALSVL